MKGMAPPSQRGGRLVIGKDKAGSIPVHVGEAAAHEQASPQSRS